MDKLTVCLLLCVVVSMGCVHLTQEQIDLYEEMIAAGEPVSGYPNMLVSGALSILPGGGQFYNGQIGLGIVDLMFWPLSYFWSIPVAILDAKAIRIYRNAERWRAIKKQRARESRG